MASSHQKGDTVKWRWGEGYGEGKISERFTEKVTRTIEGTEVTRNATEEEPAYLIEQSGGGRVLKSHTELEEA